MDAIKNFLKTKSIGWYVSLVSFVTALITLIVYAARGGNIYSPVSGVAVTMLVIGLVANAAILYKDFKIGAFIPLVFYAIALAVLLNSEMLFLSNVLTGIDGNSLDSAWMTFMVFLVVTLIASIVAFSMKMTKDNK